MKNIKITCQSPCIQMSITGYKIKTKTSLKSALLSWQLHGERIVFTNGCFDILHQGHLSTLEAAKNLGDRLVVGVNSDESVKRLKGQNRPIKDEDTRSAVLAAFSFVDAVVIFEEDTPLDLIKFVQPDVLVKGGDWKVAQIVGSDVVLANGGEVISVPFLAGKSSTALINRIKN